MTNTLYINFTWHMHQPYYKDLLTNEASMPWVRLHGVKDYLDMVKILKKYPNIKQTFNVVPSLLNQLEDYANGNVKDKFFEISERPAANLSYEDKLFILENFFMCNYKTMIEPFSRYKELFAKRGDTHFTAQIKSALKKFSDQDLLDLQVWFNLSWIDPSFRNEITELKSLAQKGRNFTEVDKATILKSHISIIKKIIPTYKEAQDNSQIEISVSPYYHPIMPLLYDINSAKEAINSIKLPHLTEDFKDDLTWQIRNAISEYERYFGRMPKGMWPSEGSVSDEIIPILTNARLSWIATDEEILYKSKLKSPSKANSYKPYTIERDGKDICLFFRDRVLSDLIGFVYSSWSENDAVDDFMKRLHTIQNSQKQNQPSIVNIIMDGENAWEYYKNDAGDFLEKLYTSINNSPGIKTITPSEFIKLNPVNDTIERLFAGSWINANFSVWIGHPYKNTAWEYLSKTKQALLDFEKKCPQFDKEKTGQAQREIYIAEGSDWNWWYGDDHSSAFDEEFDRLYRKHLSNVYTLLGLAIPEYLNIPIPTKKPPALLKPAGLINPSIDGRITSYFEWLYAGHINAAQLSGSMHKTGNIINDIYYGFNHEKFFFRADFYSLKGLSDKIYTLTVYFIQNRIKIDITFTAGNITEAIVLFGDGQDEWKVQKKVEEAALKQTLELAIKFRDLGIKEGDEVKVVFLLSQNGLIIESIPYSGPIIINAPSYDFESVNWSA